MKMFEIKELVNGDDIFVTINTDMVTNISPSQVTSKCEGTVFVLLGSEHPRVIKTKESYQDILSRLLHGPHFISRAVQG